MKIDALPDRHEQPETRNLVLTVMLVAGVPLLFIGFVIIQQFGDAYRTKITDHLTILVKKHSRTIDNFLIDSLGDIRVLARSHPVEELADTVFLTKTLAILREEYGGVFVDLGLIDPQGVQQAYSGPFNLAQADYANTVWFYETQLSQYYISDVFTGLRGSPHFIVAVKIPWKDQGWILRATVDFNAFNDLVFNIRIGTTGIAFILNRAGELQTKPHIAVDGLKEIYRGVLEAKLEADKVLVANLTTDNVLLEENPDSFGNGLIFAVTPLNNGRWILIFQQEVSDAFATWNTTKINAVLLFLFWAAIVALFTYFISRRMTLRIEEVIIEKDKMSDQVVEAGRLASIGELAAGIAHEINNPVAIMVEEAGWIQDLLAEDDPATADNLAEIQRASTQIKTQGGRCKEITHKLLSFARKTDPTVKQIDLNEMVQEMITLVDQKTRYASVQIETQLDAGLPPVWASTAELQQVLLNLLNNSVDAMDSSGGNIHISTQLNDDQIVLKVADNGMGIAEANLARIFDPFYTTKPVGQGTGLGLSICYGIIQKLGGDIQVQSTKGKGTTFSVFLPVSTDKIGAL
ncbi:MAG: two-component sensor histidine kinase [Desulfosarcina sp.]|nr:two-component sensor histidine kinase [Desulfosarcina sp.]